MVETTDSAPAGGTDTARAPLVQLRGITKAFPGVLANEAVDLDIRPGEIHALLGENGAGKSTLMNVLAGMYRPDAGEILFEGRRIEIASPRAAIELGIGTVYQHLTLVPTLTVLENLMLGAGEEGVRLDVERARKRFAELSRLLGVEVAPEAVPGGLAMGQQQQVEIMKALWRDSRVLILDEPTSMLTPQGYEELKRELNHLTEERLAVILITHKLHEAIELGDRVTVLRAGRLVGMLEPADLAATSDADLRATIVEMMFGEQASELVEAAEVEGPQVARSRHTERKLGSVALEVRDLVLEGEADEVGLRDVSLSLREGEVLGIAGVDGNGQRELAEVIAGQRRADSGEVVLLGDPVTGLGVAGRESRGLRYVTDDRLGEGTVGGLDVGLNTVLKRVGKPPFWRAGGQRRDEIDRHATELVERFDVRTQSVHSRVATLSGGNVQKLVLAREFAFSPRVIIFNKPTHGLDVRTAEFVRDQIASGAEEGVAALVISTELEELIEVCDRIAVMSRGAVTGTVDVGEGTEARVGELMVAR